MTKQELEQIREMVIHGLYRTSIVNNYSTRTFTAYKEEQVRLFDQYVENSELEE